MTPFRIRRRLLAWLNAPITMAIREAVSGDTPSKRHPAPPHVLASDSYRGGRRGGPRNEERT